MRNPNGFGGIKKLSGKRKRPYAVFVTTGWEPAKKCKIEDIAFLKGVIDDDLYAAVSIQYQAHIDRQKDFSSKQIQKPIGYYATRQEAMIALADYNKSPYDIDKRNTTFGDVYEILLQEKFSKMKDSARAGYTGSYKKCDEIKDIRMSELRKAHMQKIIDDHADKSKSLQANIIKLFNAIYKFAMENDICEKNYAEFVTISSEKESKEKVPFSRDEIQVLWDNLDYKHTPRSKSNNALYGLQMVDSVLIMIYTGVRISELLDLKKEDIHVDERWIDLKGTKTKAAKRIVPIHRKIIPLLEKRIADLNDDEYIFTASNGNRITYKQYSDKILTLLCDTLKIYHHTAHECRHSFATYAASSKLNPVLLKKIIGHSAQDITQDIYTHAFIEDLIEEIDKLDL